MFTFVCVNVSLCFCVLLDTFQEVLQLPSEQLTNFVHQVAQPELRDLTKCEHLCSTFQEDLAFHSSLSLQSLMVSVTYTVLQTQYKIIYIYPREWLSILTLMLLAC